MEAQVIALILILPFILAFIYAGIHEYRRYKSEGRASYGLVYDEETGTTHVTGISEDRRLMIPKISIPTIIRRERTPETRTKKNRAGALAGLPPARGRFASCPVRSNFQCRRKCTNNRV